jgi:hypothetical protein
VSALRHGHGTAAAATEDTQFCCGAILGSAWTASSALSRGIGAAGTDAMQRASLESYCWSVDPPRVYCADNTMAIAELRKISAGSS